MTTSLTYQQLDQLLQSHQIGMNAAELHGFLSGISCGGLQDDSWKTLVYQFTNNGNAYPSALLHKVEALREEINGQLGEENSFSFELLLDESDLFHHADSLSEWVSHFLLGTALAQPHLDQLDEEIVEALHDLNDIANLGYDEKDLPEELDSALTEISEYVRAVALFFYTEFTHQKTATETQSPTLH